MLRASSHLSTLWLSCVFRSPTHQPPSTPIFRFLMKSRFKRRRSSKAVLDAYYQRPSAGGRRANAGFMFTRRSPDTHFEDLGTSKPTSCTEFCVAQIKVHKSCVNLISSTLLSRIIRSILCGSAVVFRPNPPSPLKQHYGVYTMPFQCISRLRADA